jgi:hypothetical protein
MNFNTDDVYIYNASTREIVRTISCKDSQVRDSRHIGLRVNAGESWAKGMAAESLGLWSGERVRPGLSAADQALAASIAGIRTQPLEAV